MGARSIKQFSLLLTILVPSLEAAIQLPYYEILFRDMSDFDRRIEGSTPSLSFLDGPLMEDMLHDARTRLTEAVVKGPGRAVLFYGRQLMGEGLTADKAEMPHSYSQEQVHGLENWPASLWIP